MAAPVIIVVLLGSYYLVAGRYLFSVIQTPALKITAIAVPLILCALLAAVLIQRIREINKGEEDDLGKY